jgi:2-haloacid dehalogenase
MQLSQFKALSFDCYGTLIDWEAGLARALEPLRSQVGVSLDDLLEAFGDVEHEVEEERPGGRYSELLTIVHARLAQRFGIPADEDAARDFGQSVGDWPAFPDSATALRYLKRHFELIILSNVDRSSFAKSNERLGVEFDRVFTAEEIGSYKPDPANFDYLLEHVATDFAVGPEAVLHVAQSLFHDHAPAKAAGLATAWIDRQRLSEGGSWGATKPLEERPTPDHVFYSLAELVEAVGAG